MSQHLLRCRCGTLRGHVALPALGRAVCYCRDCRAYARFLGRDGELLDDAGGTQVVAALPKRVRLEHGVEALACMMLTPRGILRWYASCCDTPIGNTPRTARLPYVGLVHECLSFDPSRSLDDSFWPLRLRVNTESATRPVAATPLVALAVMADSAPSLLKTRLDGSWRDNPFFDAASGRPVKTLRVLDAQARARLG